MKNQDKLFFLPAKKLRSLLVQKKMTTTELITLFLDRIQKLDSNYHAFLYVMDKQALKRAKEIDALIAQGHTNDFPLLGIPIAISDRINIKDVPTSMGSEVLRNRTAKQTHYEAQHLIDLGAIIIGKTNCSEFGLSCFTQNEAYGKTRNPIDPSIILGGSEGGIACAVSAGLVPFGLGIDTMGSVRLPSCYTGIYGLKPSRNRIPIKRFINLPTTTRSFMAISPVARHLDDLKLLHKHLVSTKHKLSHPKQLKIGYTPNLNITHPTKLVSKNLKSFINQCEKIGHSTQKIDFEITHDSLMHFTNLYAADIYYPVLSILDSNKASPQNLTDYTKLWLDKGKSVSGIAYSMGLVYKEWLENYINKLFENFDLIVSPTSPYEPFTLTNPPEHIKGDDLHASIALWEHTFPFNMSGHPALNIPFGESNNGFPEGIQVIAPLNQDERLFSFTDELKIDH